jgi:NAD(P)-dependent dehydrogenase (short-subunit alcohol dehydrogenase family)
MQPVVLITGTSSGFGRATAERLSGIGMRVYGTSRSTLDAELPYTLVAMDVTDDANVREGVARVIEREGRIDVVVNNAGISVVGSIEDTSLAEAEQQIATNLFGVVRVIRAVLPHMRAQRSGKIINVSSIGGVIALPFQAYYSASKFGVEAITEALRHEVRPFGIKVCCIEPGDFRTAMTDKRIFAANADSEAYGTVMKRVVDRYASDEANGCDPALFADLVEKLISDPDPKVRHLVGAVDQKGAVLLKRLVGDALFERLFRAIYRIA